uniref:LRRCT domain-containing protein n=1 Tax=Poecilia latipinna TaxID=48699 RepID=A0A3B3UA97_9TELE
MLFITSVFFFFILGAFAGSPELEKVEFMETETNTIELGAFDGLVKLKSVEISTNPLRSVPVGFWFSKLKNLAAIRLYENQLTTIPEDLFMELPNLEEISLQGNRISALSPNLFPHKGKLIKLILDSNLLTSLPEEYFVGFPKVKLLTLRNNQLTSLPPVLFGEMPKLTELSLQQNNLTNNDLQTLSGDVFDSLTKLKKLDLSNNPWQCDCNLIDFYHWIKTNADKLTPKVHCEYPEHLKGQEITLLNEDQLVCPTLPPTTTTLPTTIPTTVQTTKPTTTLTTTTLDACKAPWGSNIFCCFYSPM